MKPKQNALPSPQSFKVHFLTKPSRGSQESRPSTVSRFDKHDEQYTEILNTQILHKRMQIISKYDPNLNSLLALRETSNTKELVPQQMHRSFRQRRSVACKVNRQVRRKSCESTVDGLYGTKFKANFYITQYKIRHHTITKIRRRFRKYVYAVIIMLTCCHFRPQRKNNANINRKSRKPTMKRQSDFYLKMQQIAILQQATELPVKKKHSHIEDKQLSQQHCKAPAMQYFYKQKGRAINQYIQAFKPRLVYQKSVEQNRQLPYTQLIKSNTNDVLINKQNQICKTEYDLPKINVVPYMKSMLKHQKSRSHAGRLTPINILQQHTTQQ